MQAVEYTDIGYEGVKWGFRERIYRNLQGCCVCKNVVETFLDDEIESNEKNIDSSKTIMYVADDKFVNVKSHGDCLCVVCCACFDKMQEKAVGGVLTCDGCGFKMELKFGDRRYIWARLNPRKAAAKKAVYTRHYNKQLKDFNDARAKEGKPPMKFANKITYPHL